ncbi:hypothetical protein [Roseovarius sp. E0-M6]|uniref:hypothetical protein n=1 Tax=Roseovarius sp. E0-M6 TaxID=3127118 RepID=UPI0030103952
MDEFICIVFVPRRVLTLYEAVYAYPKDVCDMAEEDIRLADEASESEHYDAQDFMYMYENQDMCGAIKVIVVDDPSLDRLQCVFPENLN